MATMYFFVGLRPVRSVLTILQGYGMQDGGWERGTVPGRNGRRPGGAALPTSARINLERIPPSPGAGEGSVKEEVKIWSIP